MRNDAATAAATVPQRAWKNPVARHLGRVSGRERNQTAGTSVLIDALQDARTLACETVGREGLVSLLRHDRLDIVECFS